MKVSDQYPGIKLGFSTQNFSKAMPLSVDNLKQILDFAFSEGFAFIELRDPSADLSEEECRMLAKYARERNIEVVYEIHRDLFSSDFREVFDRAVRNTAAFGQPGILRSILSWSEFSSDQNKTGWTREELDYLVSLADSCAGAAEEMGVRFILENIIEPWFGEGENLGLDNFYAETFRVGLQFDTANPFLSTCRRVADPKAVAAYLETFKKRWLTTHLKSGADDAFQPVLMDNPLPFIRVFELMADNSVSYAALELLAVDSREDCFENHRESLRYLARQGLVILNQ